MQLKSSRDGRESAGRGEPRPAQDSKEDWVDCVGYFARIHSTTLFTSASLIFSGAFGGIGI